MKTAERHHLSVLDRTILRLLNERARLAQSCAEGELTPHVEDLLRRSEGPFPAGALREAFAAVERGCREVQS